MTEPACPVCATPYERGAATCAFCGVSLVEPEAKPAAKAKTRARPTAPPAAAPDIRADAPPAPPPAETAASAAVEPVPPTVAGTDESIARPADTPSSPVPDEADATDAALLEDEPAPAAADSAESEGIPVDPAPEAASAPSTRTPSFAKAPTAATLVQRRRHRIEWGVVAGLAALLAMQVVASDFDQLAGNAATRPWLQRLCGALRCSLPPWREPQALRMLQRDVRANPQRPGLLRISASFRNDARWTQPWPRLRVTLADADGRAIAARDFAASEYLGARTAANGIASGQVASVAFDVVDPSPRVTAFTFEFR